MIEKLNEIVASVSNIFEDGKISIQDIPEAIRALKLIIDLFHEENNSATEEN